MRSLLLAGAALAVGLVFMTPGFASQSGVRLSPAMQAETSGFAAAESVGKTGKAAELALLLNRLDEHVILWLAKYEAWLPDQPAHALVYLDDEERHGVGFPRGLDDAVDAVLEGR